MAVLGPGGGVVHMYAGAVAGTPLRTTAARPPATTTTSTSSVFGWCAPSGGLPDSLPFPPLGGLRGGSPWGD
jgi:hypothetical protein